MILWPHLLKVAHYVLPLFMSWFFPFRKVVFTKERKISPQDATAPPEGMRSVAQPFTPPDSAHLICLSLFFCFLYGVLSFVPFPEGLFRSHNLPYQ